MICKNCGDKVSQNYCGQCGQKINVDKITLSRLTRELSESIFQIDSGFLFTLKELFIRPGSSIQAYLAGQRRNHFKPLAYVLILSTIYFLVSSATDQETWMSEAIHGSYSGATGAQTVMVPPPLILWFANNYAYTTLLLIPFFSLASFLSFRRYETNYLEHIVLNSYITGQQALFYTLFAGLNVLFKNEVDWSLSILVTIAYCFWVFYRFFSNGSAVAIIIRFLLTYVLYLIFCLVLFSIFLVGQ